MKMIVAILKIIRKYQDRTPGCHVYSGIYPSNFDVSYAAQKTRSYN